MINDLKSIFIWICYISDSSLGNNPSVFFLRGLSVVRIFPHWVLSPDEGKSSCRTATYSLRTGMFWHGIYFFPEETLYPSDSFVIASLVWTGYTTRRGRCYKSGHQSRGSKDVRNVLWHLRCIYDALLMKTAGQIAASATRTPISGRLRLIQRLS